MAILEVLSHYNESGGERECVVAFAYTDEDAREEIPELDDRLKRRIADGDPTEYYHVNLTDAEVVAFNARQQRAHDELYQLMNGGRHTADETPMREFVLDVKLWSTAYVKARSEKEAQEILAKYGGLDLDLVKNDEITMTNCTIEGDGDVTEEHWLCSGCGRREEDCSADPCAAVQADRGELVRQDSWRYACPECLGTRVQVTAWVDWNTDKPTEDEPPTDQMWCPDCGEEPIKTRDAVLLSPDGKQVRDPWYSDTPADTYETEAWRAEHGNE